MKIQEKIKRFKKHYREGGDLQKERIEAMVRDEINKSPESGILWAELMFNGEVVWKTLGQKRAEKLAEKHNVRSYKIKKEGIEPC